MKIVIFGGSGFIGQKLAEELVNRGHHVSSISRSGKPADLTTPWSQKVEWIHSDILNDTAWQDTIATSDWVIDTIGILFEKPQKNITYDRFIIEPVRILLHYLTQTNSRAKLLFLSANTAPLLLKKYMNAKLSAEELIKEQSPRNLIVYPSLVVDHERPFSMISAKSIRFSKKIPGLRQLVKGYDPISRQTLAIEIANVIEGKSSVYTKRRQ
ncbi:NAD-dependent epimerase/dehydratase family protein [Enterococcus sp. 5H]|uniref:NAD-dependent epimerase/dehydratase family protein n=1 Tax=Enterococcus sp. 5H TaxID=1229490 RepID=UPI00230465A5|nr:NAD-dependent epimerase/dehydratase family protein [Enterococcus sp. 5H]MDA9470503.1 NADH dehydrogenase [Enterococcus sp. 5H]